jgi:signal transduction histidine kinase/ligand-binding sensor domain-containing protein/DNA-binding response OmpR family regulator
MTGSKTRDINHRNFFRLLSGLIWLVIIFSPHFLFGQTGKYQFGRIDMSKGLSHPTVNDILQDSTGFLWFVTSSGLNRYDGYSLKVFKNIPGDSSSLQVDNLTKIFEGPDRRLWILSTYGNIVYNPKTENFERNTNHLLENYAVHRGVITFIKKDKIGRFWFIHYNQGLFCFDPASRKTVRLTPIEKDTTSITTTQMSSLAEDSKGNMWVIHQNGVFERIDKESLKVSFRSNFLKDKYRAKLYEYDFMVDADDDLWIHNDRNFGCYYFNSQTNQFKHLHPDATQGRLNSSIVNKILQDDNKLIWMGMENGGINLVDKKDFSVNYILNEETDTKSLAENTAYAIYKDRQGIIWIGSFKSGVSFYHPDIFRFELYKREVGRPETLPFNDINAFAEDEMGNIWIGTNGGGLIYFNRKDKKFTSYRHNPASTNSLSNDIVVSLLMDHEGVLWIGTYYGGLNSFDGKKFTNYVNEPENLKSLGNDNIWEIYEDSDYNIWLGTLNGGLDVFNRQKREFYHYKSGDVNSVHTPYVPAIIQDKEGNMLVGTGYGLEVLNKSTGRFTHYLYSQEDPKSISSNSVQCIYQDSRGWIWVGTSGGLNLFDQKNGEFSAFREQDGLAHNSILTITEDRDQNLWMSTPKGITKLSITTTGNSQFTFHNYTESDGLIQGVYHENSVLRCASGELVFGGSGGFNIFDPTQIKIDSTSLPVVLTDFLISNQSVKIDEVIDKTIVLSASINQVKKITLGPGNNFFSIEFAALNFFHPEKSKYKYILEGFNEGWLTTTASQRRVTFTNLDPGDYVFKVRGTNSDGIWNNQETQLHITVLPPFWKSNLAFVLYAMIILMALLFGRRLIVARERLKFSIQTERLSAQRLHELDMMKIKFFTNVSHELRTPLTLIITPLEKLLKNASSEERKQFQVIYRNARRLLNLVNQLLDFKRMEGNEVTLNASEGDIVQFIRDLVWSFSDLSDKKNIHLSFHTSIGGQETFFDMDKIEKIIFNLLSNAFKFTPDQGYVTVSLNLIDDKDVKSLEILVSDTGIGIPPDKQQRIFERFYQHDLPQSVVNQGSGIGLSITQEFVNLHGGTIRVESEVGKGSTFIVKIPIVDIHADFIDDEVDMDIGPDELGVSTNGLSENGRVKTSLLLVEDNEDFRNYLKDNLKDQYAIIEASNGKQGLEKALALLPDLIISDVMMPELSGVELCKKIKEDPHTSHIPVILLTARAAREQEIEGFHSGANDYITKPFSFEVLESRIQNLLNLRSQGHKQFQKHLDIKISEIEVASVDEKLVRDAVKLVEDNLVSKDFSVEEMSRMLGMSRVHLYKKLYSLTGKTPIEFIRFIRIQRAAQLLEKSNLTISEVAYQVGFNHPKYFTKYFRDLYDVLPSQYAASKRQGK